MRSDLLRLPHILTCATGAGEDFSTITNFAHQESLFVLEMQQVHGAELAVLERENHAARLTANYTERVAGVDAVISRLPGTMLIVRTADCVPILIAHPSGVIGAVHAGRRGTEEQIVAKVLQFLRDEWQITDNLSLWIGPHICVDCYEVDRETHAHYALLEKNVAQISSVYQKKSVTISIDDRCTCHLPNDFHSYRREGAGVAMNYAAVGVPRQYTNPPVLI